MARLKTIGMAILAVLILIVMIQNMQIVSLKFLFWTMTLSLIVLLPLLIAVGFLAGYVVAKWKKPSKTSNGDKK